MLVESRISMFLLWSLESWALELGIQLKESKIPLMTVSVTKNQEFSTWDLESMAWKQENPRLPWIPVHRVTQSELLLRPVPVLCPRG